MSRKKKWLHSDNMEKDDSCCCFIHIWFSESRLDLVFFFKKNMVLRYLVIFFIINYYYFSISSKLFILPGRHEYNNDMYSMDTRQTLRELSSISFTLAHM